MLPVAIAHAEEMERWSILDVWSQYECVLIDFIRVVRLEAYPGGECKLFNHVFGF